MQFYHNFVKTAMNLWFKCVVFQFKNIYFYLYKSINYKTKE